MPKLNLTELKEELDAKRSLQRQVFDEAKVVGEDGEESYDFKQVECLGSAVNQLEGAEKAQRVSQIAEELRDAVVGLEEEIATAEAVEGFKSTEKHFEGKRNRPPFTDSPGRKVRDTGQKLSTKQIAKRIVEDPLFQQWKRGSRDGRIEIDASLFEAKTLMTTSSGWAGESTRTGVAVDIPLRPPQLIDILPRNTTGQPTVVYMEQDTRTQAAAEISEGDAKPEAAFVWTETSTPVEEIAVSLPVTDRMLEDSPMMEGLIETQLREDMMERLDQQALLGNGTPPNLGGILDKSVLTTAVASESVLKAIARAIRLIQTGTSRATPTHILMHPADWEEVATIQNATSGEFILGNPHEVIQPRIWGLPVVINEELTEDTALVGSFMARNIQLYERRGINVEWGWTGDQFVQNKRTIKMYGRWALAVYRPTAFCTITSFNET